jgi:16S rRNA (guanine966-N2)-methyltransferase
MRIIGGRYRGRPLKAPTSGTRPTTDRTREAVFSLVLARTDLIDGSVLDLFAGSGALGLEALSRGAGHATFVEQSGEALRVIRANAASLGASAQCTFHRADALRYLKGPAGGHHTVVFADPPYDLEGIEQLPALALPWVEPDGLFVLEHDARLDFDDHPALSTSRAYGQTIVSVFRAPGQEDS